MKVAQIAWVVGLLALPLAVQAAGFDFVVGPSLTSSGRTTAAAFASAFGKTPASNRWHFEPVGTLGVVLARHTRKDDLHHTVGLAGGGVRITVGPHPEWFVSEQLAATSTRTDALSTRLEFMTSVGWQRGRFILLLRHISNATLFGGGRNLGETMLLAGVRW